jgi:hypothetical protein
MSKHFRGGAQQRLREIAVKTYELMQPKAHVFFSTGGNRENRAAFPLFPLFPPVKTLYGGGQAFRPQLHLKCSEEFETGFTG